jgi:hypothetical protein
VCSHYNQQGRFWPYNRYRRKSQRSPHLGPSLKPCAGLTFFDNEQNSTFAEEGEVHTGNRHVQEDLNVLILRNRTIHRREIYAVGAGQLFPGWGSRIVVETTRDVILL